MAIINFPDSPIANDEYTFGNNTWVYDGAKWNLKTAGSVVTKLGTNLQTGTSYTLVLADAGKRVDMSNAAANTLTVPPNSSVAFPVDTIVYVSQSGAGATSIAAGSGVTISTFEGLKVGGQFRMASLIKTGTNTWLAIGTTA